MSHSKYKEERTEEKNKSTTYQIYVVQPRSRLSWYLIRLNHATVASAEATKLETHGVSGVRCSHLWSQYFVGGLKMDVVNVVMHRYEHSGMPPALSGYEPDKVGPTQTFATE